MTEKNKMPFMKAQTREPQNKWYYETKFDPVFIKINMFNDNTLTNLQELSSA